MKYLSLIILLVNSQIYNNSENINKKISNSEEIFNIEKYIINSYFSSTHLENSKKKLISFQNDQEMKI